MQRVPARVLEALSCQVGRPRISAATIIDGARNRKRSLPSTPGVHYRGVGASALRRWSITAYLTGGICGCSGTNRTGNRCASIATTFTRPGSKHRGQRAIIAAGLFRYRWVRLHYRWGCLIPLQVGVLPMAIVTNRPTGPARALPFAVA